MDQRFHLRLFGPPELLDSHTRPVVFRTRKQLAALVYLYLEARARGVVRDELAELLWPEVPLDRARHSLSQTCSAVRERLGAGALESRGEYIRLLAPLASDLDLAASLARQPVDLTRPLKDLDRAGGVEFAHWVERARPAVVRQARSALYQALSRARVAGEVETAYNAAQLLLPIDPTCAIAAQVLAERTLLDGDTIGAIRLLREYLSQVRNGVGANPHPEITRLLHRLERGNGPPLLATLSRSSAQPTRHEAFVGRESEMARLESAWARAGDVPYQACLITGPVGIGKSSVLRRFAATVAARTGAVFLVLCQEIGQRIPFAAVSDLIRALARDPASSGTDPRWLAEASRVSPGLRVAYPGIPEPPDAPADSVRLRVAEALHHMLASVADGAPVLLAIDDMHHMDHASLDVLFLLIHRLDALHLLLAATERWDDGRPAPAAGDGQSLSLGWREFIELDGLRDEHAVALLAQLSEGEVALAQPVRDKIVTLSQGNPYHLEILLADFRQHAAGSLVVASDVGAAPAPSWRPPETMRLAFARLYQGLSSDSQRLLHVLAVAGRAMEISEVTGLVGLEGAAADRTALEVVENGVARFEAGRLYFKNEVYRAFVYWAMSSEARQYFHGRLGARFAASGIGGDFQRSLEASHHFTRAGMQDHAVSAAVRGSEVAVARGAMKEAERALRAIVQAYPQARDARVQLLLATALVAEGRNKEALDELALSSAIATGPADRSAAALLKAEALHRGRLADDAQISRAAADAAHAATESGNARGLAKALQIQAEFAFDVGDASGIRTAAARAQQLAGSADEPIVKALALLTTGYCSLAVSDFESGANTFQTVVPRLDGLSLKVELRRALNGLGICRTATGSFESAVTTFECAAQIAAQLGDQVGESNTWSNLATLYHDLGEYEQAVAACCRALKLHGVASSRVSVDPLVNAALLAVDLGGFSHAEQLLATAARHAERSRLWQDRTSVLLTRAHASLARGDADSAWPLVEEALTLCRSRTHLAHPDLGLYYCLEAHYVLVTKGQAAVERLAHAWQHEPTQLRIADDMERRAFLNCVRMRNASHDGWKVAFGELVKRGLIGRVVRLRSALVHLRPLRPHETPALAILRFFPDGDQQRRLPSPDDLLLAAGAL
jgi:DNA-binding SARP family transcriptional activator/tetratricopeptide (TPR) repeat protein